MNWDAIGAIADAVGAVAVVVSLVYVAIQIRQNTEQSARSMHATEVAAFERNIETSNRLRETLLLNPDLGQLYLAGTAAYEALDPIDRFRFNLLMRNIFMALQGAFIRQAMTKNGVLDSSAPDKAVDDLIACPGVRAWLASGEFDWRPGFRDFVNERLRRFEAGQQAE